MKPFLIFLVDDDPFFLRVMEIELKQTKYLRHYNYDVKSFSLGENCLANISENPNIVILDYQLDSKFSSAENGLKILKRIKYFNRQINVMMLSVQDKLEIADALHEAGADEYIIKNENSFSRINKAVRNVFDNINMNRKINQENFRNKIYGFAIIILIGVVLFLYSKSNFLNSIVR